MPTPSEISHTTKDECTTTDVVAAADKLQKAQPDADELKTSENNQKKKHQPQPSSYNESRHKFSNRPMNQIGNRQNRNNSTHKRATNDSNNNNKPLNYKPSNPTQQKQMPLEYQQPEKQSNGHLDSSKKHIQARSITKSNQNGNFYDNFSPGPSHKSSPAESPALTSPNYTNDAYNGSGDLKTDVDGVSRKYTLDFLHKVGYSMTGVPTVNVSQPLSSSKTSKNMDEILAVKMALGDNSGNYNHFYAGSVYGNQALLQQQQQYQQQLYSRFQQQQQQQQTVQRFQRMYTRNQPDSYTRMYYPMYHEQESLSLPCHCPQSTQQLQRGYNQSYSNSPSYQNRKQGERHEYRDYRDNTKKPRNGYNNHNNNGERHFKGKDYNNRSGQLGKSNSFTEENTSKRKNPPFIRTSSEENPNRSLSPTPPSSSKSSSPGAQEKRLEKDIANEVHFDLADDSASTASASSSGPSGLVPFISDMKVSLSAPLLHATEEPSRNVNLWIDNNFGSALHNGLSHSAEHLNHNYRDVAPIAIIKRPPSVNGVNKRNFPPPPRPFPAYDPLHPFEYFLARTEQSEMRKPPSYLRCNTKWDCLSEQMWAKFQVFQQSRDTYHSKMTIWRDLHNYVKNFPVFTQRNCPKWGLFLVGSTISGFGSDTSDIDMCLVSKGNGYSDFNMEPRVEAMVALNDLKNYLAMSMSPFQNFILINAKVPILRFRDASNKIEVDLNYNNCVGVRNTHLLYSYSQLDWRLRPLALIVKLWAQFHNINDARNSTISSYSLVLMVIHFMQFAVRPAILPCLQQLCPEKFRPLQDITSIDMVEKCDVKWHSDNRQPLGELFLRFLDYYSNFDYANNAISIRTGGVLPIEECKNARSTKNDPNHWQTLCIEEPFDLTNTARSAYDCDVFLKIKDVFFKSWYRLNETRELDSVFRDPLFTQQQQLQMQQMKFITPNGHSNTHPILAPANDVKS